MKKMNRLTIIILLLVFGISCRNSFVNNTKKRNIKLLDSIYLNSNLPKITVFDLKQNLEIGARKWTPLNKDFRVDSAFYKAFIENDKNLGHSENYQEFFYVGIVDRFGKKSLVLSQWIGNGDECYMYLLDFSKNGELEKYLLIAKQYKSPDDYDYSFSKVVDNSLQRITVNWYMDSFNQELSYKDSIVELFELKELKKIKYDSTRIE
jgi:hypothetical protein